MLVAWIIVSEGDACCHLQKGKMTTWTKYILQIEQICEKEELLRSHSASCPLGAVRAQTVPIIFKKPRTNNSLSLIYFSFYLLYWKGIHLTYISRQTRDVYDSYCWPHVTKVEGRHYSTVILDFPCLFEHFLWNPCMCHELWAPDLSSFITWNPKLFHTNANDNFKLWNLRITTRK